MTRFRTHGPICLINTETYDEIDTGTLVLSANHGPGIPYVPPNDPDRDEFMIIQQMPVVNASHPPRHYTTLQMYLDDRNRFFGPGQAYQHFCIEADAELYNMVWAGEPSTAIVHQQIEHAESPEWQRILYRWVRKAYKRTLGENVNVPAILRGGMSVALARGLQAVRDSARVRAIHDENFPAKVPFVPRPKKIEGFYRLGTLSEHGTGYAVDVDDLHNPQFTNTTWAFIEQKVNRHLVREGRWGSEAAATGLWRDIVEINRLFVAWVATQLQTSSLAHVLGSQYRALKDYATTGFFNMPLERVLEFRAKGFTWGATWDDQIDLQHFELLRPGANGH